MILNYDLSFEQGITVLLGLYEFARPEFMTTWRILLGCSEHRTRPLTFRTSLSLFTSSRQLAVFDPKGNEETRLHGTLSRPYPNLNTVG
jgi:hypothetical protein